MSHSVRGVASAVPGGALWLWWRADAVGATLGCLLVLAVGVLLWMDRRGIQ